ncbi:MAG: DUF2207 domain-containing protein [Clostridia bacterium]|nr:DUF2207 domain-containing protein [Clostridia bacterium]
MKKFYAIMFFTFMFLFFIFIGNVNANTLNSVKMDIFVDDNGDANVTEIWDYTVNSGTENYHSFKNIGNSEFTNLRVSDENTNYTFLSSWNVNASFDSKAYKCGIHEVSDGVELCWGISSYGRHTYTLNYTITNFVSELDDCQMIYWGLIPSGNTKGSVYIKIHSNFDYDFETPVWGYGNYGGTCYVYDGYIEMQSDGKLDSDEYMTILAKFPLGTFNTSNVLNKDFNYYYEMAEDGSTDYSSSSVLNAISVIFPILFFFFIIVMTVGFANSRVSTFDFGKTGNKVPKDIPLYRDIPCKGDIFRAYFVADTYKLLKKKTDFLGAIFLKWLKENRISIEKQEVGKIFKKEDTCIILKNDSSFLNEHEEALYKMIKEASKDEILQEKEFEKWCSRNYSKILNWFDKILDSERDLLVSEGIIELQEVPVMKVFKKKKYVVNDSLMEEAKELAGLKKFLEEFTLIKEREPIEVNLFEDYLIFAQILGIAKKVASQFKKLYPEIIESYNYDFDDIFLIYAISNSGISSANTARSRAESYSSGGGGFSSGGGRRWLFWWAVDGMGSR